jgi:hypothetical protein
LSSTRRFDGPDLEVLLEEVRRSAGDEARILEANRLRRGGIAGFFARERFEVVVEVGEEPPAAPPAVAPVPRSLLDLVEDVSEVEAPAPAPVSVDPGPFAPAPATVDPGPFAATPAPGRRAPRPLVAAPAPTAPVARAPRPLVAPTRVPQPTVSTQGGAFAAVLDRMAAEAGLDPATGAQVGEPDDDEAGFEVVDLTAEPPSRPVPAPVAARPVVEERHPAAPLSPARRRPPADRPPPAVPALVGVGLPPVLCAVTEPGRDEAILAVAHRIPRAEALPDLPGTVVAVVGAHGEALRVARRLAGQLDVVADEVLLAAPSYGRSTPVEHRVPDVGSAAERRRSVRRRRGATVVAVAVGSRHGDTSWGRQMLDALEPTLVCGVVDATRKPEDVSDWCERLGGLDALAVHGVADTVSPASVLQVGVPVGWLEGEPASPARWAATLAAALPA